MNSPEVLRPALEEDGEARERLRKLVELLPVGVWMADDKGHLVMSNEAGRRIWAGARYVGIERFGEYKGWWPDGRPIAAKEWPLARAIMHGETRLNDEIEIECFDGTRKTILNSAVPIPDAEGRLLGALVTNEDITERKRAQRALQESNERFEIVARATNDAVWDWDLRAGTVKWNAGYQGLFGYLPEETKAGPESWYDHIHAEDKERVIGSVHAVIDGGDDMWSAEYRFRRRDGRYADIFDRGFVVRGEGGRAVRMIGAMVDLSDRKRAERALRESEDRFRSLSELASDWFWETDEEHRFLYTPQRASQITGLGPASYVGKRRWEVAGLSPVEGEWRAHQAVLARRESFRDLELVQVRPDGSLCYLQVSGEPRRDAEGRFLGYRGTSKDVTARRSAQAERERLGRMYASLSALNESVVRAGSVEELLKDACETAVSSGDFTYALVRLVDAQARVAHVAAHSGIAYPGWLDRPLELDPASPDAHSVVARACRTGRPALVAGAQMESSEFLRRFAGETGVRAVGAYPLHRGGRCVGALLLCSRDPGGFAGEMHALLERMASDVSHGLETLEAAEELRRFRLAVDHSADIMVLVDRETMRFVDVNDALCRLLGYARGELIGRPVEDILTTPRAQIERAYDALIADPSSVGSFRSNYRCKDGSLIPFESTRRMLRSGGRWLMIAISRDIRERLAADERARRQDAYFRSLVENVSDAIGVADMDWRYVYMSPSCESVTGHAPEDLIGRRFAEVTAVEDHAAMRAGIAAAIERTGRPQHVRFDVRRKDGEVRTHEAVVSRGTGPEGEPIYVIIGRDITERKRYERRIEHLANFDALTDLPNRNLLRDRVEQAIAHARRTGGHVGLMFVDLDQFKLVNDSWGHAAGDALLLEVARRLQATVRDGDTVSRLGGDEFVVLCPDLARPGDTALIAGKVAAALAQPGRIDGREVRATASIGISLFPGDGEDLDSLLQCADAAMYRAKEAGRDGYQFYSAEMSAQARARVETEAGLRQAIDHGELRLHYQPQVALASGAVLGFEALMRWERPGGGLVSPAAFIPVAEESGLIVPMGKWALGAACREAASWQATGLGARRVAVNLSARQFWQGGVTDLVRAALEESGLAPEQLELEITESVLARDLRQVMLSLEQLRRMGVTVAIDDFGTGYSSLAYLRSLPIGKVKIDKSFIEDIPADTQAAALVAEIVRLAHVLSLEVVAEGVETAEQARFLRAAGCEAMQGYLFSRPLPAAECAPLLRSGRRLSLGEPPR